MNKSNTFKAAHSIARRNEFNFGTYAQRFARALAALYLSIRTQKQNEARTIKEEAIAAKKQAIVVAERKANRKPTNPTSSYFGAWSWEAAL